MRYLIVETYYLAFLNEFYASSRVRAGESYCAQWRALMERCFGIADYYSTNLTALGHEATEIVANCEPLQRQWAREHGVALQPARWSLTVRRGFVPWPLRVQSWFYPILAAQIRHQRPDVLYIQDMNAIDRSFLQELRPHFRLLVGQIASNIPPRADYRSYDLVLSSFPHYVTRFRQQGLTSHYFRLGFEPRILEHLGSPTLHHPVVFVGGLTAAHSARIRLLEQIAAEQPLAVWGYDIDQLAPHSPLHATYQGNAWALEMYRVLQGAAISLNHHIDLAEDYANNMRLYEATGVGSLLLTDAKANLHTLFEPDREVVTYRSAAECVERIQYLLDHPDLRARIARAGQARTLRDHTYAQRMEELSEIVAPLLQRQRTQGR